MNKSFKVICVCPGLVFKKYHLRASPEKLDKQIKKLINAVGAKYANIYEDGQYVKRVYKY